MAIPTGTPPNDYLFPEQWDHQLINTRGAWDKLQNDPQAATKDNTAFGNPEVIIAICDVDGVDVSHADLNSTLSNGAPKIAATFDFGAGTSVMKPRGAHGTSCASAAASIVGTVTGVAGVAGNSAIMAICNVGNEETDADMFEWVAGIDPGNSEYPPAPAPGAAIISNSTITSGGLPEAGADAIKRITLYGRGGKGTLLFCGAGNDDAFFDKPTGYRTHPHVMAVAASTLNSNNLEVRATYSSFGAGIAFCAPSSDTVPALHNPPIHRGIFAASQSVLATHPVTRTTVKAGSLPPGAPPNSVLVNDPGDIGPGSEVVIGQLSHVDAERYRVIEINQAPDYLILDHAPRVPIKANDEVLLIFGNCPGHNLSNDTLKAAALSGNELIVNNPGLYGGGKAIIINPHTPLSEAHAIQRVNPATGVITLMSSLKKSFGANTPIVIGNADYTDSFGGTSHATPLCAGIAALCLAANKNLSWVEVREIMRHTAQKINPGEKGKAVEGIQVGQWRNIAGEEIVSGNGQFIYNTPAVSTFVVSKTAENVITVLAVKGFEPGQAIELREDIANNPNVEVYVISAISGSSLILETPLSDSRTYKDYRVAAGHKPHYSAFYGYGRVNAAQAVEAALATVSNYRQLLIRNDLSDTATALSPIIQSPDIWVTHKTLSKNNFAVTIKKKVLGLDDLEAKTDLFEGTENVKIQITIDGIIGDQDTFSTKINDNSLVSGIALKKGINFIYQNFYVEFKGDTGHHIGDSWTIFIDCVEPAMDYTRDAVHENPQASAERFIHARIKNNITGTLAAQYKNLDCQVRFYIALANGKTANATNQGGQGFDSNFYFSDNGKNNDWDDARFVSEITSGEAGTYFVGEIEIPEGLIEPSDPSDPGKGIYTVSIPWHKDDIPPAALAHSVFLLAHLAPFHGPMNGKGAHNNSCLSYREITFASFSFHEDAVSPLEKQLQVDPFGSIVVQPFSIQVKQPIGHFITEKLQLEVVRLNDNGTEEKAVFIHNGTVWTFDPAHPQWTGLQINAPILLAGGALATGNQSAISFEGQFQASKENKQLILRPKILSKHSTVVIAAGEHLIDIVETGETPIGLDEDALAAPPPPKSHAFADMATIQQSAAGAFGPVTGQESIEFRVTSLFTATADTNAYAITDGFVFLQPGPDPDNTVNLVLRPFKQAIIGFTPVKYFIYRGLRKADFLNTADPKKILPEDASNSEFINRQRTIHAGQNAKGAIFLSKVLGYDPDVQQQTDSLDAYFFRNDPNFQLPFVTQGMQLGRYYHRSGYTFGLDIVLEEGSYDVNLAYVQQLSHTVKVSGMPVGTIEEQFSLKLKREEILHFLDPAAFYGMHLGDKGTILTRNLSNKNTEEKKGQDIYTAVVSKFHTRNKVYLDIRNENGDSYNFYGNYKGPVNDPDHGKNCRVGITQGSLTALHYQHHEWPLVTQEGIQNVTGDKNLLFCSLRMDDNAMPVLYLEQGTVNNRKDFFTGNFIDAFELDAIIDGVNWTRPIGFDIYNTGAPGSKLNISTIIKLIYGRGTSVSPISWPDTVLKTESPTDNMFGPVNFNPLWQSDSNIKWITAQDKKYVDFTDRGFTAERGVAIDAFSDADPNAGRVVFFGVATDYYHPPDDVRRLAGITGGVSTKGSFFEAAGFLRNLLLQFDQLQIGGKKITTLQLIPGNANAPTSNSMLLLCISRKELETLKAIPTFHPLYPRYIKPELVPAPNQGTSHTDDGGKPFKKYRLKVQGLNKDGKYKLDAPGTDIIVYSVDQFLYFSDAYSKDEPMPTTYNRTAEENIGALMNTINITTPQSWEDFFIGKDLGGAIKGVVDAFMLELMEIGNDITTWNDRKFFLKTYMEMLPLRARGNARENNFGYADDRSLYWGRIKMKVLLQSHIIMLQDLKIRNEMLELFEKKTRGYENPNFADFDPLKRVLLIGFDPYSINPNGGIGHNILNSNPSGAAALALHGYRIQQAGVDAAIVQSMIFPARYTDFDNNDGEGIVEKYLNKFIDPSAPDYSPVDHIIVMDKFLPRSFMFSRFAARQRGTGKDNGFQVSTPIPSGFVGDPFYESGLQVEKAVPPAPYPANADFYTFFNQTYEYRIKASNAIKKFTDHKRQGNTRITNNPDGNDVNNLLPVNQSALNISAIRGSGNPHFANETFYRLCVLQQKKGKTAKVGLLLLPTLQGTTAEVARDPSLGIDFSDRSTQDMILALTDILKALVL